MDYHVKAVISRSSEQCIRKPLSEGPFVLFVQIVIFVLSHDIFTSNEDRTLLLITK